MKEKFVISRLTICTCGCGSVLNEYYTTSEKFGNMGHAIQYDTYQEVKDNIEVVHALYGKENDTFGKEGKTFAYGIDKIFVP